ncbi:hypothetical protein B7463_g3061, partial [Scytalidium lignicola]
MVKKRPTNTGQWNHRKIESNLDSLSITPHVHRQEFLRYVHRPTLYKLEYESSDLNDTISSRALVHLCNICHFLHIQLGPTTGGPGDHLAKFRNQAIHIFELLEDRSLQGPYPTSLKVKRLMSFLDEQDYNECSGLLFVRQRATVTARRKNLIIATDALEEGIDVAACNLVICFDPPPNVKSFIQRRGRARQEKSKFAIMFPKNEGSSKLESWRTLEATLIQAYQSQLRQIQCLADIEGSVEVVPGNLEVNSTGACLTPDSAIVHINHFCARLPHEPYVDLRPAFVFQEQPTTKLIAATVVLPNCLNQSLRSTTGIGAWRSERAAAEDAAFQAYVALHKAGLLNDNLLPLSHTWELEEKELEYISTTVDITRQLRPWAKLAEAWSCPEIYHTRISLLHQGSIGGDLCMVLTTPSVVPQIPPLNLYWDHRTIFSLRFDPPRRASLSDLDTVRVMRQITHVMRRSIHSDYIADNQTDYIVLFSPHEEKSQLITWYEANSGRVPALERYRAKDTACRFIRAPLLHYAPHLFHRWHDLDADHDGKVEIECIPLPKRRHFLARKTLAKKIRPQPDRDSSFKVQSFPIEDCTIDRLPFEYARFSLFTPAILQHLEAFIVADTVRKTVLLDVSIKDLSHIVTAISAPSAGWITNYQRYEFFGDTVLKFTVSHQLFCDNGNWHEGYLSQKKNRIISNQRLAKAALSKGLDEYIMTEAFKSRRWWPWLISEIRPGFTAKRNISAKVIADVVEALIGAAYIDGGLIAARECICTFLPEISISPPRFPSYTAASKALLVEALTHPSCDCDIKIQSYQRLEFLGDAVLDMLVLSILADQQTDTELSQGKMTVIKSVLVNAHFLGFLSLDFGQDEEVVTIIEQPGGRFSKHTTLRQTYLWKLMRHSNAEITKARGACLERYTSLHEEIKHLLREGETYP